MNTWLELDSTFSIACHSKVLRFLVLPVHLYQKEVVTFLHLVNFDELISLVVAFGASYVLHAFTGSLDNNDSAVGVLVINMFGHTSFINLRYG